MMGSVQAQSQVWGVQAHNWADLMAGLEQANQASDGTLVAPMEYLEVIAVRR